MVFKDQGHTGCDGMEGWLKGRDAHKAGDVAAIDSTINNLNTVMQAASQQMYQGGQQAGPQGAQGGQQAQGANDSAQDVQDADFEEVK